MSKPIFWGKRKIFLNVICIFYLACRVLSLDIHLGKNALSYTWTDQADCISTVWSGSLWHWGTWDAIESWQKIKAKANGLSDLLFTLTLCVLGKKICSCHFEIFYFFFQKISFDISCKLSPNETICVKCQSLFSGQDMKNISKCHLLKFLSSMLNFNMHIFLDVRTW